MNSSSFSVGKRKIGDCAPVFIVAEMSANHLQDKERAYKIIAAAAEAGADAIKLQTYTPDKMTINSDKEWFIIKDSSQWHGQTLYQLYQSAYTPWEWHQELKDYAESKGLIFFSSAFDTSAVEFLENLNVSLYKVASFEATDIPLLKRIAKTKKPVIASRGLANYEEIKQLVFTLTKFGTQFLVVLHCVSSYPAKLEQMQLAHISQIRQDFDILTGLSDHTLGIETATVAVALGAVVIEKHLTLLRSEGGPDAAFSLEPPELKSLVDRIRTIETYDEQQKQALLHSIPNVEMMIGTADYTIDSDEKKNIKFRRSLFVVKDINAGERFTRENTRSIRPGYGLAPSRLPEILDKTASQNIERGTPLLPNLVNYGKE